MMALMARLSTQSLGDNQVPTLASPNRPTGSSLPFNTDKPLSSTPQRTLSAATTLPPQQQSPIKSSPTSPVHAVRKVAKRLPRALQGPLTFDICMLLPTPLDERQSPLRSPVRRKRLRKRVRRRLRRRSRRSWQASHASWPPHASADYIVDHARQDIAGINAARLVQRLGVNTQALSRASSMPLPPLKWNSSSSLQPNGTDEEDYQEAHRSEDDEQESDGDNLESDVDDEDEDNALTCNNNDLDSNETPLSTGNTEATTTPSISEEQERVADTTSTRRRPLYHQPAWISPELHTWLVTSGLFATKPRHELLSTDL
ncbi:hypothetical protein GN958_ATG14792 [Phytophthora infestans]|uniref:Uncharacterized protein n=1 Tax=Phytophthora infestans TaxID=4787 RepID=A0A8S9U545_PHYIN|nr:hypothetical protein GN958_ATG14792 [Phytophthora infestans]